MDLGVTELSNGLTSCDRGLKLDRLPFGVDFRNRPFECGAAQKFDAIFRTSELCAECQRAAEGQREDDDCGERDFSSPSLIRIAD